jgi:simple sugar transport system ATP-binding protein
MLIDKMTIMENIVLGKEITKAFGALDLDGFKRVTCTLADKYGFNVDPLAKVSDISVGMQQKVEILKILYRGADILIFDEPTAVLAPNEIEEFIKILKNLSRLGKTIILITHKLKEVDLAADLCTIIRKGKNIATINTREVNKNDIANMMVGREVMLKTNRREAKFLGEVFSMNSVSVIDAKSTNKLKDINLSIKGGEILGIAGVDNNGQKELVEAIMGLKKVTGKIKINKKYVQNTSPQNILNNKISVIYEDRHKMGLILDFSVLENSILTYHKSAKYSKGLSLSYKNIEDHCKNIIERYNISPNNCEHTPIKFLSGGNQQKLVIGRELSSEPDLLIAVQPVRGLDIGAIEFMHNELIKYRDAGHAILLISYELDEILSLSDTIAVIYNGRIKDIMENKNVDINYLGLLMMGGRKDV